MYVFKVKPYEIIEIKLWPVLLFNKVVQQYLDFK